MFHEKILDTAPAPVASSKTAGLSFSDNASPEAVRLSTLVFTSVAETVNSIGSPATTQISGIGLNTGLSLEHPEIIVS